MRTWLAFGAVLALAWACGGKTVVEGKKGSGGSGGTASATSGTSSMAGGLADASSVGSSESGAPCTPACGQGLTCCNGHCVNHDNDILNCHQCDQKCAANQKYCDHGLCSPPPCMNVACPANGSFCCGNACCKPGQLCCNIPMGVETGPKCTDPVNGTCPPGCPACQCAAPETPVATPRGERPIAELRAGDLVYSVDHGRLAAVPILALQRNAVSQHHVMRVTLAGGRVLRISGRHPTADGRLFGELAAGDALGGVAIASVERVPYPEPFTYDILPASDSGAYFAAGALVGSTMTRSPVFAGDACWTAP